MVSHVLSFEQISLHKFVLKKNTNCYILIAEDLYTLISLSCIWSVISDANSVLSDSSTIWRDDADSMVGSVCWVSPESVGPADINPASTSAPIGRAEVQLRYENIYLCIFFKLKIIIVYLLYIYMFKFLTGIYCNCSSKVVV